MKKKLDIVALQIDLARQKETVEYVKEYIDFAKSNGYNTVFLYLEAMVRVECTSFFNEDESYSVDEIKDIVAYGNAQGIDIIPALENLSHLENFIRYPQLAWIAECEDFAADGRGLGSFECACSSNPKAMEFLDTYYSQVIPLFTSKYVHAGLDEPFDFAVCERCQDQLKNGKTKGDLFYEHVMRTYNLVKSFGRTMMMWDDFFVYLDIAHRLPRDIIMCTWNYEFIQDEIPGHWVSRVKRDWFKYYDELGFTYMFCTYANKSGNLFNIDTLTNYANKYSPRGALMTSWIRTTNFNLCSYPTIAYAGRLWSGKIKEKDRVKVYAEYLGSEETAKIVLDLESAGASYQPNNLQICENFTMGRYVGINVAGYAMEKLKATIDTMEDGLQKDILVDIYRFRMDGYLGLLQHRLCLEVFDNYETRAKKPAYFIKKLEEMKEMNREVYAYGQDMWARYRDGIKSFKNQFDNHYLNREKRYDDMIAQLEKNEKHGVFYADMMMFCYHGTPRMILEIHYKDKTVPATVYRCSPKVAGVNTVRYAMENKAVDYVLLTTYGESAAYPVNFRYTYGGKKYIVSSATKVEGDVKDLKKILTNDTRCAQMGTDDGYAHFDDLAVSKKKHTIKLKFKRLK